MSNTMLHCWCFFQVGVMATAIALIALTFEAHHLSKIVAVTINQMHREFGQRPFVEIDIRDKCNEDEEVLFSHVWPGTESGCYHNSLHYEDWVDTVEENNRYNNRVTEGAQRTCFPILMRSPIVEDTFYDKQICGRRGGEPYKNVQRVDASGKCPEGTVACSNLTSAEDTICYPLHANDTECPINDIKFIDSSLKGNYSQMGYQTEKLKSNVTLVYSTRAAGAPVMSFALQGAQPCIEEEYVETPDNGVYYPLEKARIHQSCPFDENINQAYDTRYTQSGFSINEYDLQRSSGVLEKLHDLPLYRQYVRNEQQAKSAVMYNFYQRSLIPWKLSCEHANKTRADAFQMISAAGPDSNEAIQYILWEAILFLLAPPITFGLYLCTKSQKSSFVFLFTMQVMILLFMSVLALQQTEKADTHYSTMENTLHNYAYVNGCSDDFTKIDVEKFKQRFVDSSEIVKEKIIPCMYGMVAVLGMNLFVMMLFACGCIKGKNDRRYQQHQDEN